MPTLLSQAENHIVKYIESDLVKAKYLFVKKIHMTNIEYQGNQSCLF